VSSRSSPSVVSLPHSPSAASVSSTDSTPVSTPTSQRHLPSPSISRSSINPSNFVPKSPIGRCQLPSSPAARSPSNVPLPLSPKSPTFPNPTSSRSVPSDRPLRVAFSASNLRREVEPAASHRATSSDPSARPCKKEHFRLANTYTQPLSIHREERSQVDLTEPSEPQIQWGYAI